MIINSKLKHLHIHVPKTGGESIEFELRSIGEWNLKGDRALSLGKHATLLNFSRHPDLVERISSYYKTVMIRNPWEHAVSYYRHALDRGLFLRENFFNHKGFNRFSEEEKLNLDVSFERFIKEGYNKRCQSVSTREIKEMGLVFNEWFNYNEYSNMLETFEKKFKIKIENKFRRHDKKKLDYVIEMDFNKPYQEYYNDETYEIVKKLSINEINRFNYKF